MASALSLHRRLPVRGPSEVAEARRRAVALLPVAEAGASSDWAGRVALAATELATNLVKHGRGGVLLARPLSGPAAAALELIALDRGPGVPHPERLVDGFSTAGTLGVGLGSVRRASAVFDFYTAPGRGMAVLAQVPREAPGRSLRPRSPDVEAAGGLELGEVLVPFPGEETSGDACAFLAAPGGARLFLVDASGHGLLAHETALRALEAFEGAGEQSLVGAGEAIHAALRHTRGAALGLAEVDLSRGAIGWVGVGNVLGMVCGAASSAILTSFPGVAGEGSPPLRRFEVPWPSDGTLLLCSDGVSTRVHLGEHPGLSRHHPTLVAAVLYRDFGRTSDDASVLVARRAPP